MSVFEAFPGSETGGFINYDRRKFDSNFVTDKHHVSIVRPEGVLRTRDADEKTQEVTSHVAREICIE